MADKQHAPTLSTCPTEGPKAKPPLWKPMRSARASPFSAESLQQAAHCRKPG
jgi:hypothetical protein